MIININMIYSTRISDNLFAKISKQQNKNKEINKKQELDSWES